jgi:hypothetical protein
MEFLMKDGVLTKYDSPASKFFPKEVMHPELGPQYRNAIIGIVYHSGIIKPAEAPKSLEDLLKPQYRGKVVIPDASQHTTTAQWMASLHKVMGGHEKADKFLRDLAATKPLLVESLTPAGSASPPERRRSGSLSSRTSFSTARRAFLGLRETPKIHGDDYTDRPRPRRLTPTRVRPF